MASEERKAENRKLVAENLFKAQAAAPQQAETDAFQCGKCKQRRCMYYQVRPALPRLRRTPADVLACARYADANSLCRRADDRECTCFRSQLDMRRANAQQTFASLQTFVTCLSCNNRWKFS